MQRSCDCKHCSTQFILRNISCNPHTHIQHSQVHYVSNCRGIETQLGPEGYSDLVLTVPGLPITFRAAWQHCFTKVHKQTKNIFLVAVSALALLIYRPGPGGAMAGPSHATGSGGKYCGHLSTSKGETRRAMKCCIRTRAAHLEQSEANLSRSCIAPQIASAGLA
jgi:hypothetical protein